MSVLHRLKTWPEVFEATAAGLKTAEFRINDRNFQVGDSLMLQEYNPETCEYTGNHITMRINHILYGNQFGIPSGYVVISIS